MVERIMCWLMKKAKLSILTPWAHANILERIRRLEADRTGHDDELEAINSKLDHLDKKLIELDGVCIVNGEDIEELRAEIAELRRIRLAEHETTNQILTDKLNEYFYGYQGDPQEGLK